jgi:hypothetical protein
MKYWGHEAAEIVLLCCAAGFPEEAADRLLDGASVEEVARMYQRPVTAVPAASYPGLIFRSAIAVYLDRSGGCCRLSPAHRQPPMCLLLVYRYRPSLEPVVAGPEDIAGTRVAAPGPEDYPLPGRLRRFTLHRVYHKT